MRIRLFESDDESRIAEMHNTAFSSEIDSHGIKYDYELVGPTNVLDWISDDATVFIAETSGNLVGYLFCQLIEEAGRRKVSVLEFTPNSWNMGQSMIGVLPDYRREGVGTRLIQEAIEHYLQDGLDISRKNSSILPLISCTPEQQGVGRWGRHAFFQRQPLKEPWSFSVKWGYMQ